MLDRRNVGMMNTMEERRSVTTMREIVSAPGNAAVGGNGNGNGEIYGSTGEVLVVYRSPLHPWQA